MSKERIPYFNFYPIDFMRGVRGLTAQEVGIYTMLLCRMYEENGPVDLHEERLAAYCGCRTSTLSKTLLRLCDLGKITLIGQQIFNTRAAIEIDKRNRVVKSNSIAGVLSAEKRKQNQQFDATPVKQTFNHTDTDTDTDKEEKKVVGLAPPKSRLPEDWALSDEGWEYARSQHIPDNIISDEAKGFHAYWTDRRDRDATKSARGWEQCWANRCRQIAPKYAGSAMAGRAQPFGGGSSPSLASIVAQRRAAGLV